MKNIKNFILISLFMITGSSLIAGRRDPSRGGGRPCNPSYHDTNETDGNTNGSQVNSGLKSYAITYRNTPGINQLYLVEKNNTGPAVFSNQGAPYPIRIITEENVNGATQTTTSYLNPGEKYIAQGPVTKFSYAGYVC